MWPFGVTPVMHDFWNIADPAQHLGEVINFTKNAALMGAALMMLLLPRPWPFSLQATVATAEGWSRKAARGT